MLWSVTPLPFGKARLCLSTQNSLQLLQYGSPDSDFVKVKHFCSSKDIAMSAKGKENRLMSLLEETIQQDGIKKKKVFGFLNVSFIFLMRCKAIFLFSYLISLHPFYLLFLLLIFIHLGMGQIFIEHVLCAKHRSSFCECIRGQSTVTSRKKPTFLTKTDTDSFQNKLQRDCCRRCPKRKVRDTMRKCHSADLVCRGLEILPEEVTV